MKKGAIMNPVLEGDILNIVKSSKQLLDELANSTILITGSTGLVGSIFVRSILASKIRVNLILVVRDQQKAEDIFGKNNNISYVTTPIEKINPNTFTNINYIVHCASPTKSKFFIENPVETEDAIVLGTKNLLEVAKAQNAFKKFLYLSSMEMYGTLDARDVDEEKQGYINPLNERSSYPMGKRMAELYVYSYMKEYNIPITIARLAMCFGAGISTDDNRVHISFCKALINNQNITVKSSGKTLINFVYTVDAINALLLLLVNGKNGEAYNIAADNANYTILDMAYYITRLSNGKISVDHTIPDNNQGFAPDNFMTLSNAKIKSLGWKNSYNIEQALMRLIEFLRYEKEK